MRKILNAALLSLLVSAAFSCSSSDDGDEPAYF